MPLTSQQIQTLVEPYGVQVLATSSVKWGDHISFQCACGQPCSSTYHSVVRNKAQPRCSSCLAKHKSATQIAVAQREGVQTLSELRQKFESQGAQLLTAKYQTNRQKLDFICSCGQPDTIHSTTVLYHSCRIVCKTCLYAYWPSGSEHANWKPDKTDYERRHDRPS